MRRRTTTGAILLAAIGSSLVTLSAAHADQPMSAPPTTHVPPTIVAAAPPDAGGATTVTSAPAVTPTPAGAGLPADATTDQLATAIQPMFGPTTDAMGEFALFGVTPPAGVPTPTGAEVEEFEIAFDGLNEGDPFSRGVVVMTSTQPAADLVTLYQTGMVAAGFTQTGDSVDDLGDGFQIRRLEYDAPNATHPMSSFTVEIRDDDVDRVHIEWRAALDPAVVATVPATFASWSGVPLVDQADLIEDATIGNYINSSQLHLATSYHVAIPYAEVEAQFLAALAGTPFTADQELSRPGDYVVLDGEPFERLQVIFGESHLGDGEISEIAIDASLPLAVGAAAASPTTIVPAPPTTAVAPTPTTVAAPPPSAAPTTLAAAPTTAATPPTTVAAAPTTVATAATTVAAAPVAAGLPAHATIEQLAASMQPMFGPTTDAMGELAVLGTTPLAGVPTPAGADVLEFQIHYQDLLQDEPFYYAVLVMTSTQPAVDLVTLYQSGLVAAGYTQTGDSVNNTDSGRQIRWLDYDIPGATHFMSQLSVGIVDDDVDFVQIEWYAALEPAGVAMASAAFTTWSLLPIVDPSLPVEDARIGNFILGDRLSVETGYAVAAPPADVEAQLLAAVPGSPFTVDQDLTEPGSYTSLDGGPFDDLTVYFTETGEGTTALSVDALYLL